MSQQCCENDTNREINLVNFPDRWVRPKFGAPCASTVLGLCRSGDLWLDLRHLCQSEPIVHRMLKVVPSARKSRWA